MASSSTTVDHSPPLPRDVLGWLRMWFLLRDPVVRKAYAISGFGLMALKYVVEMLVLGLVSGLIYTLLDFVNPLISSKAQFLQGGLPWLGMAWIVWSLPFLWIAVGMSVRRALDAGISPWHGLWIFVPFVNLVAMLALACLPSAEAWADHWNPNTQRSEPSQTTQASATLKAAIGGIAVGALYAVVTIQIESYLLKDYGGAMFLGTPFVTGVAASYLLNLRHSHSAGASFFVALMAVVFSGGALLLFAAEGFLCLIMAAPLVVPMGLAGAPIGKFLADRRRRMHGGLVCALIVVPLWASPFNM